MRPPGIESASARFAFIAAPLALAMIARVRPFRDAVGLRAALTWPRELYQRPARSRGDRDERTKADGSEGVNSGGSEPRLCKHRANPGGVHGRYFDYGVVAIIFGILLEILVGLGPCYATGAACAILSALYSAISAAVVLVGIALVVTDFLRHPSRPRA